jgi:hypothetical protein
MEETKMCRKCGILKILPDFDKDSSHKSGYSYTCKECRRKYAKEYAVKNKEKIQHRAKCWRITNKESLVIKKKKYAEEHRESIRDKERKRRSDNKEIYLLNSAKYRATFCGLDFNLDISDIVIPDICPCLGIPISRNIGITGPSPNSPTLDRIDNTKGYVKGNVCVISYRANKLKNDATIDEVKLIYEYMSLHLNK